MVLRLNRLFKLNMIPFPADVVDGHSILHRGDIPVYTNKYKLSETVYIILKILTFVFVQLLLVYMEQKYTNIIGFPITTCSKLREVLNKF